MVAVTEKIRSMVDILVRGFDQRENVFEEMGNDVEEYTEYPTQNNLALEPNYSYRENRIKSSSSFRLQISRGNDFGTSFIQRFSTGSSTLDGKKNCCSEPPPIR